MTEDDERQKYPRLETNGQIPGRIRTSEGVDIDCRSVDVSKYGVSILTQMEVPIGSIVTLVTGANNEIPLEITAKERDVLRQDFWRLDMYVVDNAHDVCHVFDYGGCLRSNEEGIRHREERAAPRYVPKKVLEFKASLIGSREPYRFQVENLSRSGLLLSLPAEEGAPFQVNTLLDLEIDENRTFLNRPLRCTGKVVRMVGDQDASEGLTYYGIMITDVPEHHAGLDELIRAMEEELEPKHSTEPISK